MGELVSDIFGGNEEQKTRAAVRVNFPNLLNEEDLYDGFLNLHCSKLRGDNLNETNLYTNTYKAIIELAHESGLSDELITETWTQSYLDSEKFE